MSTGLVYAYIYQNVCVFSANSSSSRCRCLEQQVKIIPTGFRPRRRRLAQQLCLRRNRPNYCGLLSTKADPPNAFRLTRNVVRHLWCAISSWWRVASNHDQTCEPALHSTFYTLAMTRSRFYQNLSVGRERRMPSESGPTHHMLACNNNSVRYFSSGYYLHCTTRWSTPGERYRHMRSRPRSL